MKPGFNVQESILFDIMDGNLKPQSFDVKKVIDEPWKRDMEVPLGAEMAKCVMQFPKRFNSLWTLQPFTDVHYIEKFNNCNKPFTYKEVSINKYQDEQRNPVPDYNSWLFDSFLGTFGKLQLDSQNDEYQNWCSLIDRITAYGDIKLNEMCLVNINNSSEPVVFTKNDITVWFSFLKSQIPISLVDENKMPPVSLPPREGRNDDDHLHTMEYLGVYRCVQNAEKYNKIKSGVWYNENIGRKIWLCPNRIRNCAEEKGLKYENLLTIVCLHEIAHAALDSLIDAKNNLYQDDPKYIIKFDVDGKTLLTSESAPAFAMEESLANMIMLKYLECYAEVDNNLFGEAKIFVESQKISEYKFGLEQFNADVDWMKWRDYKSQHDNQDDKLNEWFNSSFKGNSIIGCYTKDLFDKVFS